MSRSLSPTEWRTRHLVKEVIWSLLNMISETIETTGEVLFTRYDLHPPKDERIEASEWFEAKEWTLTVLEAAGLIERRRLPEGVFGEYAITDGWAIDREAVQTLTMTLAKKNK